MNFIRTGLLLLLLGTGITLILLSRCVEKPLPAGAELPSSASPPKAPPPRGGSASRPSSAPASRPSSRRAPALPPSRKPLAADRTSLLEGIVVDERGLPVEGARVEALDHPPTWILGDRLLPMLQVESAAWIRKKAGRGLYDTLDMNEEVGKRLFLRAYPAGPLEPHAVTGPEGRFRLTLSPWKGWWLRARKGNLAGLAAHPARPGDRVLLVVHPAASLEVEVRDRRGRPVPACPVKVTLIGAGTGQGPGKAGNQARTYLEGKTGKNGTFTFLGLPAPGSVLAAALPPGGPPAFSDPIPLDRGAFRKVLLQAGAGGSLRIRVLDEKGAPLGGARVRLYPLELPLELQGALGPYKGVSPAGGEIAFSHLLPGTWGVQAFAPGREPASGQATVRPGKEASLELTLSRGRVLEGLVKNRRGDPLPGALVGFSWSFQGMDLSRMMDPLLLLDPRTATRTGPEGRFRLEGLPEGARVGLTAWAPGYAPAVKKGIPPSRKRVVLVLDRTGAVEGRVLDPQGRPVRKFLVQAWREAMMGMRSHLRSVRIDSPDGSFRLEGIPPGDFLLILRAEGLAPLEVPDLEVEEGETLTLSRPLCFALPSLVEGDLRDPSGAPAPGARVKLLPRNKAVLRIPGFSSPSPEALTDREGRFRLKDVPAGLWRIVADAGPLGWAEGKSALETKPGVPLRGIHLVLEPPASLEGRVYEPSGRPSRGTTILLQRLQAGRFLQKWARTDRRGRFFVSALPPGKWQVLSMGRKFLQAGFLMGDKLRKEGSLDLKALLNESRMALVNLSPGEKGTVTLGAPRGSAGVVEGRVTAAGAPLEGAMVTLSPLDGADEKEKGPRMAATGADGRYRLEGVAEGKYLAVILSRPVGGTVEKRTIQVRSFETTPLDVDFGGGKVRGRLVPQGPCGSPAGRLVFLLKEGGSVPVGSFLSDSRGRFEATNLAPGVYRAYVRPFLATAAGAPVGRSGPFQVGRGGEVPEIQVLLEPSAAVAGSLDRPVPKGTVVTARVEGWPDTFQARTDASGLFRLGGLPPGRTRIEAKAGGRKASLEILTTPGETTRVVLHLQ